MADPPDPDAGGILGLLGKFGANPAALYQGALSDPATQQQMATRGLLAMAGSFADSAMPTRMPTPLGAVLGHAAAAAGASGDAVMAARLQAAQGQQALAQSQLTQQDVAYTKMLPGLAQRYNDADGGGNAVGPAVPGTIGNPSVPTASVDTGHGPPSVYIPPGTPTATWDPKMSGTDAINGLAQTAAPMALPAGYTVKMTSGARPGAVVAGTNQPSQHADANAADFRIYKPDGTEIKNEAGIPDTSGYYGKLAATMRAIADPSIKPWLAWGGNFGKTDIMHFDLGGDRGHVGSLAQMEQDMVARQQAPPGGGAPAPVRMAQANTGTMTDAGPAGAPPGLINPQPQPGVPAPPPPGTGGAPPGAPPPVPSPSAPPPPPMQPGPQSLVPPPPSPAPVPPITMPQPQAPGPAIPGAPSPAKIRAAQEYAAALTALRRPIPPDVEAVAKFGLVGPTAAAQAWATVAPEVAKAQGTAQVQQPFIQQNEAQKAQVTAQWNLWVDQNKPILTRPNTLQINPQNGQVFGNYEAVGPDGSMHRYLMMPGPSGQPQKSDLGSSAISPYQTKGSETVATKNADDMATVNKDASAAAQSRDQATNMRQEAPNFYTGPGAAYNQDLNKVLLTIHPDNPGLANSVASYETFMKDAGMWARQQAQAASAKVGVQELKFVASSSPSEETSQRGLDRVLSQIQGVSDYKLAKQQAMNAYVNQPGRGGWDNNGFEAQFNANVSPYAFMYMRYSDQDRAEMVNKLSQTKGGQADIQRLMGQIKYITDNNLMQR